MKPITTPLVENTAFTNPDDWAIRVPIPTGIFSQAVINEITRWPKLRDIFAWVPRRAPQLNHRRYYYDGQFDCYTKLPKDYFTNHDNHVRAMNEVGWWTTVGVYRTPDLRMAIGI